MYPFFDRENLNFILHDVLECDGLFGSHLYNHIDRLVLSTVFDTAERLASEHFEPLAAPMDQNPPRIGDAGVVAHPKAAAALEIYREAGLFGAGFSFEDEGMQLPYIAVLGIHAILSAANCSLAGYPFLTIAAANMLATFGTDEQKTKYLKPMIDGRWYGTMCLSEPQAGSSLADLTTTAEPQPDGTYRLRGGKTWISAGGHDLSENIVHMVLARTPGAPAGVKGLSLFIVPQNRFDGDSESLQGNDVSVIGLNHKMGYRGISNTVLNFGEKNDCRGELLGELNKGLLVMFHMMNEARIGVGMNAAMSARAAYEVALSYAKERKQGRSPSVRDPNLPQRPIIEHPDVKRLLLAQRASVEGAETLLYYCAYLVDKIRCSSDDQSSKRDRILLELLTPVAKSWPSEFCLEANKHAIQVLGGYGYTIEYPVERHYRDNRLNPIHEGTHGVQGLDLLGRKLRAENNGLDQLFAEMDRTIEDANKTPELSRFGEKLSAFMKVTADFIKKAEKQSELERATAAATPFLDCFGHLVVGWLLLKLACVASDKTAKEGETAFLDGKHVNCRYFFDWEVPQAITRLQALSEAGDLFYETDLA